MIPGGVGKGDEEVPIPPEDRRQGTEKVDSGYDSASDKPEEIRILTGSDLEDAASRSISRSVFQVEFNRADKAISVLDGKLGASKAVEGAEVHTNPGSDIVQQQQKEDDKERKRQEVVQAQSEAMHACILAMK